MSSFNFKRESPSAESQVIFFDGSMDENAKLPTFDSLVQAKSLVFDFENCGVINSSGIKTWVKLMYELSDLEGVNITLRNCQPLILDQINMIEGFLPPNGTVESIHVRLFCEKCEKEFSVLKKVDQLHDGLGDVVADLKQVDCETFPKCKQFINLDMHPDKALTFMHRMKK